ncbi:MAG: membrane protein insertion efficiency factor YidD [Patescibacteria group bacterium]
MLKKIITYFIVKYQKLLSPDQGILGRPTSVCRFYPSCSEYARQAILVYGLGRGGWLAIRRLLKCHPWHRGGFDYLK